MDPKGQALGTARLERFCAELEAARIGSTFNQYRLSGADDASPEAPEIRLRNLRRYLEARTAAPVVLVAEAAGWRGGRYSGLCLCSERQLAAPFQRSSHHPGGWAEASAAVVQGILRARGWSERVLLFNVVPTHPAGATDHSNRRPTLGEVAAGAGFLAELLELVRPAHVAAIGGIAAALLGDVPRVRHPAHGGAARCREQIDSLLSIWLPGDPRLASPAARPG